MNHTKEALQIGYKLVNNIKEILYYNRLFTDLLKNITETCDNFINEIESDVFNHLNKKQNENTDLNMDENKFIYNTTNGMISYDERSIYLPLDDEEDDFQ